MNPILNAGLLIGLLSGGWIFAMGLTGWYKNPALMRILFVVSGLILIEIGGLIWGLRRTAAQGRTYGGQIVAGAMMAVIAGVIIITASLLFTTVAFPEYFQELESAHRTILQQQGKSDAEIAGELSRTMSDAAPMNQALQEFIGTFITGILASAVIAIWVRRVH
jgi:hypothetical protein